MALLHQEHPMAFRASNSNAVAVTTQASLGYVSSAYRAATAAAQAVTTQVMLAVTPSLMPGALPVGQLCLYQSGTYGWLSCKVISYNPSDGTYDLDIRAHAAASQIAPVADAGMSGMCTWPAGSLVSYHSRSQGVWMPTHVVSFNVQDGTYNLGVCEHARPDRIRARTTAQGVPNTSASIPPSVVPLAPPSATAQNLGATSASLPPSAANMAPPLSFQGGLPEPIMSAVASIEPVIHPGHEPRQDEQLVAVIVTISSGHSYDQLFSKIPQLAGEGKRVATYAANAASLPYIDGELSGSPVREGRSSTLHRNLRHLIRDMSAVQPDSIVFNWECCGACSQEHFPNAAAAMALTKHLLNRGHMVMFSDFSLKALIKDWREDLLGPKPFLKTGELHASFKLGFDAAALSSCPSAQLKKLGELASNGEAESHAMDNTIAFSVQWQNANCSAYDCKVLTVMTECDGASLAATPQCQRCEVGGHRGLAGHVLLTYPCGGKLLASAGHWVELSRLDVTEAALLEAAAVYGAAFQNEIQTSMASCSTTAERRQTISTLSTRMIQSSSPGTYSISNSAIPQQPRAVTMPAVL